MKLNQALSWKILLPVALIAYIIFRSGTTGISEEAYGLLVSALFAIGMIDVGRNLVEKKK
ncbi:MAG: hypothetical protein HYT13_00950 [Candidatus Liptonbacteria bacterium]|nr:hypothetical protein [Candidatus Liptonbacteria bacterium]